MNTLYKNILLGALALCVAACATGKNAFDKGNYNTALDRAVKRLQSNPNNKKAQDVLIDGYSVASEFHLKRIQQFKRSQNDFKWESIYREYTQLNNYYRDIQRCPSCMSLVSPKEYFTEQEEAASSAAEVQVTIGKESLALNTIETARQAYSHFEMALRFNNNIVGIDSLLTQARQIGTVRVLIEPIPIHSRNLKLTNEYLENKMFEYLDAYSRDRFVQFFSALESEQRGIEPDHILSLDFDDFVLGQAEIVSKTVEIKRDSVVVGEYTDKDGNKFDVYNTVKADFTSNEKTLYSAGVLNFEIRDAYTNKVLTQRKLRSEDIWRHSWASFNGDSRALDKEEIQMSKRKELPPPDPQTLFISFIDRVYGQVEGNIRQFYRNTEL
ncbi:hypothetical protein [Roseivirga misakiensis]|uniref:Lipoprotein n=1 Tax=Roseivirga misakiensis TaxID=1563681 RepID=A0A1E5T2W7_9BACT|nr:hypothetical protein [Roseivirga misakiensis]OEK05719.1 hypothetical protein BFP71_06240 [Roseivirga misakiensis]